MISSNRLTRQLSNGNLTRQLPTEKFTIWPGNALNPATPPEQTPPPSHHTDQDVASALSIKKRSDVLWEVLQATTPPHEDGNPAHQESAVLPSRSLGMSALEPFQNQTALLPASDVYSSNETASSLLGSQTALFHPDDIASAHEKVRGMMESQTALRPADVDSSEFPDGTP